MRLWRCVPLPGCNEFDGLIVAPSGQRSTSQRARAERSSHLRTGRTHRPTPNQITGSARSGAMLSCVRMHEKFFHVRFSSSVFLSSHTCMLTFYMCAVVFLFSFFTLPCQAFWHYLHDHKQSLSVCTTLHEVPQPWQVPTACVNVVLHQIGWQPHHDQNKDIHTNALSLTALLPGLLPPALLQPWSKRTFSALNSRSFFSAMHQKEINRQNFVAHVSVFLPFFPSAFAVCTFRHWSKSQLKDGQW